MPLSEGNAIEISNDVKKLFPKAKPVIKGTDSSSGKPEVHFNSESIETEQLRRLAFMAQIEPLDISIKRSGTGLNVRIY